MAEKQCNLLKNGGGMSNIVYSTDEMLIGYVNINGTLKKCYSKLCVGTSSSDSTSTDLMNISDKTLLRASGFMTVSGNQQVIPYTQGNNSNNLYEGSNHYLKLYCSDNAFRNSPYRVIVEYYYT